MTAVDTYNYVHVTNSLVYRYAVNRAHRYKESVFGFLTNKKPVRIPYRIKKYTRSLNHDFNISNSCLAGKNHALPQHLPNPVHFLSIRRLYFHSNAANHPAKAKAAMFNTDVGSNLRSALELIGREAHVLVLRMREAFHRWKFPALCLAEYRLPPLGNTITAK